MFNLWRHSKNHTPDAIGVADVTWFNVPRDTSFDLRKVAIGGKIETDRKLMLAGSLPPLVNESQTESFETRMNKRFDKMVFDLAKIPRHFVLQESFWLY